MNFKQYMRLLAAALLLIAAGCQAKDPGHRIEGEPQRFVFPEKGAYTGAYVDLGETEDAVTLDGLEDFEQLTGRHLAVIAVSSYWGEQRFPLKGVQIISRHKAVPLIYWSPWDRPYQEERGPDRFNLDAIVAGTWDDYIDQWADQAKAFGKPLLVSWGLEMNGSWFPWSGAFYGGGGDTAGGPAPGPERFKAAFRHVVDRVRSRGVTNILWGFHANTLSYPLADWNRIERYYPGPEYVDWLGLSAYGKQAADDPWLSFHAVMDEAYKEICALDPAKPLIVAEWGVGEYPQSGNKAQWIAEAFQAFEREYPRVKAAVYWHERWKNSDDSYSNLHVHSSPESLEAYRKGIGAPYWVDSLIPAPEAPAGE